MWLVFHLRPFRVGNRIYYIQTRSISFQVVARCLVSPGHQQQWYWPCEHNGHVLDTPVSKFQQTASFQWYKIDGSMWERRSPITNTMELSLHRINPKHAGTELSWFNQVNFMVADFLAPCFASSHDIDYVEWVGPCLIWARISTTCVISMWRNDIKCKYMFYDPSEKN